MPVAIVAQRLGKRYGDRVALSNVDLTVERGSATALLGRNGAGKTTLLRILSGGLLPSEGRAEIEGSEIAADPAAVRQLVGFVPQEAALHDELTPRESIVLFATLYGQPRRAAKEAATRLLETVGLSERAESRNGSLSGGMRSRLSIALGLVHDPRVLLLDEPTSGLDPGGRASIWRLLHQFLREGRTLVVGTHDLEEARTVCARALLLDRGRSVASGSTDEVLLQANVVYGRPPL